MLQDYAVFKNNSTVETTNKYRQECIDQVKVHIVIATMRTYARIDYDFDTLNNAKQHIKSLSNCNIGDKVRAYVMQYVTNHQLPSTRMPKVISDVSGVFELYIDDVDKVGNDISKIIANVAQSGCIEYATIDDFDTEFVAEMKEALAKG